MLTSKRKHKLLPGSDNLSSHTKSSSAKKNLDVQLSAPSEEKAIAIRKKIKSDSSAQLYKQRHNIGRRQAAERVGCYTDSETAISFQGYESYPSVVIGHRKRSAERHPIDISPTRKSFAIISTLKTESALNSAVNDLLFVKTESEARSPRAKSLKIIYNTPPVRSGGFLQQSTAHSDSVESDRADVAAIGKRSLNSAAHRNIIHSKNSLKYADVTAVHNSKIVEKAGTIKQNSITPSPIKINPDGGNPRHLLADLKTDEKRKIAVGSLGKFKPKASKTRMRKVLPTSPVEMRMKRESCLNAETFMSIMYSNERPSKKIKLSLAGDEQGQLTTLSPSISPRFNSKIALEVASNKMGNISNYESTNSPKLAAAGMYTPVRGVKLEQVIPTPVSTKRANTAASLKRKIAEKIKKKSVKNANDAEMKKKVVEPVVAVLPRRMASLNAQVY